MTQMNADKKSQSYSNLRPSASSAVNISSPLLPLSSVANRFRISFVSSCLRGESALLEDSVEEPFAGLGDAEEPVSVACGVEDVEVVADFPSPVPPLARDALRAADVEEAVHSSHSIRERNRLSLSALGGANDHADPLRFAQQSQGAEDIDLLMCL